MKKLLFIAMVMVIPVSCNNNDDDNSALSGFWIEKNHKADTLVFQTQYGGFVLYRGTEQRDGFLLPKNHSGPYMYELENDSISLRWSASSSSYANKYYFKLDLNNKEMKVENFFVDSIKKSTILTFIKVD